MKLPCLERGAYNQNKNIQKERNTSIRKFYDTQWNCVYTKNVRIMSWYEENSWNSNMKRMWMDSTAWHRRSRKRKRTGTSPTESSLFRLSKRRSQLEKLVEARNASGRSVRYFPVRRAKNRRQTQQGRPTTGFDAANNEFNPNHSDLHNWNGVLCLLSTKDASSIYLTMYYKFESLFWVDQKIIGFILYSRKSRNI